MAFAETTGTLNLSTKNESITTGLFAYTVSTCSSNSDCFDYKCFFDFDSDGSRTTSSGLCNATSVLSCIHDTSSGTFSITPSSQFFCVSNTTYRECTSSAWGSLQTCSSGQTCVGGSSACSTSSSSSAGAGGASSTTPTVTNTIDITSAPSTIEIVQGNSFSTNVTVKNTGNATLTNITLSISGIESGWYSVTPTQFILSKGNSNSFSVTFSIPQNATVKSYTITFTVTAKDGTTDSQTATLNVLPGEEAILEINQTLSEYSTLLEEVEKNLTAVKAQGAKKEDVDSVRALLDDAKEKISQANSSISQNDYFSAKQLLDEAKQLLDAAARQLSQAGFETFDTTIIIIVVVVVIAVAAVLAYILWPERKERKILSTVRMRWR